MNGPSLGLARIRTGRLVPCRTADLAGKSGRKDTAALDISPSADSIIGAGICDPGLDERRDSSPFEKPRYFRRKGWTSRA